MNQTSIDRSDGLSTGEFSKKASLFRIIKNNFSTFGYSEIKTPTFESYDLYQSITGTVEPDSMIKIIDPSGKVLVMRPDVTIPITKMQVSAASPIPLSNQRLFYIENVFRMSDEQQGKKEWTQAGVENFAPSSTETDSEVITLAAQILRSLGFDSIRIQVGLASFFRPLLEQVSLTETERKELQSLIRAKNISELELFLAERELPEALCQLLIQIPYLYGEFNEVIESAKALSLSGSMLEEIRKLEALHHMLELYKVDKYVSLDLGLINHMDYYSGIIFQGYVENVGKPVLMGGRYDQLASQMGRALPAIGFACDSDALLEALTQNNLFKPDIPHIDAVLTYDGKRQKEAIQTAEMLRENGLRVIVTSQSEDAFLLEGTIIIRYKNSEQVVEGIRGTTSFSNSHNLLELLLRNKEEI
ncbi:ATP phosphoribosyltransferase regulatory subunit [Virgibacillus necropolis]|uniref:ATP phosphoribosyltransferase regulatory subunit n=1 Tax=Virgibacillus necropolis TaxID=163877 RepID=UPI0038514990